MGQLTAGGPGQIRTADLRFRKPSLYPPELQGHYYFSNTYNSLTAAEFLLLQVSWLQESNRVNGSTQR